MFHRYPLYKKLKQEDQLPQTLRSVSSDKPRSIMYAGRFIRISYLQFRETQ